MNNTLQLENTSVRLSDKPIVNNVSFHLEAGEIGCLLGPSGCGKTTLLRAIAGFEPISHGSIQIDGKIVSAKNTHLAVEKRKVGMVFQDYALFPHLKVSDNISFALKGWSKKAKLGRLQELATLLAIPSLLEAFPHRLSGGQQQRVAIARAMAPRPDILLLDEPFASMDVELREQVAHDIRIVLKQDGITALLVSHNQLEAFAMADHIGVMNQGELLQWDTAFRLYHQPNCSYVAGFIGDGVLIPGSVMQNGQVETELGRISGKLTEKRQNSQSVSVLVRPDDVIHDDLSSFKLEVADKAFRGAQFLYTLKLPSGTRLLSLVPSHHNHAIGEFIGIRLEMEHLVAFSK